MKISPERYLELTLCMAFLDAIRYGAGQMRRKYKNPGIVFDDHRFKFAGASSGRMVFPAHEIGSLTSLWFGKICAEGIVGKVAYAMSRRNFQKALNLAGLNEPRHATAPTPPDFS